MKLTVTVDVEEEGLFSGSYQPDNNPISNVKKLGLLNPIFKDLDIKPTLFTSYPVVSNQENFEFLMELTDKWRGEIGAHLHHWNTPPFEQPAPKQPVPSQQMERNQLQAKIETLLEAMKKSGVEPISFRMGRFNMSPKLFSILESTPIKVDSSVAPMRRYYGGPDCLAAPTDPYFPNRLNPCKPGISKILEVPMTIIPVLPGLGAWFENLGKQGPLPPKALAWLAQYLFSMSAQPLWTGIKRLKTAVKIHQSRGGQVINIFFHSFIRKYSLSNIIRVECFR